jgi:NADH-quinone oxidoreductase subunit L
LIGTPFFAGYYSKDSIIVAVQNSTIAGSGFAFACVLTGVFITALYSFRMYFLVFHGKPRMDDHTREHLHETPKVVTVPLILLAIPSVIAGYVIGPVLFGGYFDGAIYVAPEHNTLAAVQEHFHDWFSFALHAPMGLPFWLAAAGVATAWFIYMKKPEIADNLARRFKFIYNMLLNKYGFDRFNEIFFASGSRGVGGILWRIGDMKLIDGLIVNGSARTVGWFSSIVRQMQTGYLYHYAFVMIIGLLLMISWFIFDDLGL